MSLPGIQLDLFDDVPHVEPQPSPVPEEPQADESIVEIAQKALDDQPMLFAEGDLMAVEAPPEPFQTIYVHFERLEDIDDFAKLIGQPVSRKTRLICYPMDEKLAAVLALKDIRPDEETSE